MSKTSKINYSPDALAYIGDAVFELLVRDKHVKSAGVKSGALHKKTVEVVNAGAQAKFAALLSDVFTEEEKNIFKRGRNTAVHSMPKNAKISEYCKATGLEAVFGYLYLNGNLDRVSELFNYCMKGAH